MKITAATKGNEISIPRMYFLIVSLMKNPGVLRKQIQLLITNFYNLYIVIYCPYLFVESMPFFKPEGVVNGEWHINKGTKSTQDDSEDHTSNNFTISR
jgi:hypothetical protein